MKLPVDVEKDLPEFHSLLSNLDNNIVDSIGHINKLYTQITNDNTTRDAGLSFLEMKCHLYLEYLINLTYSMILKVDGKTFVDQPCIERLVEIRTVLEKIRPIDKKLSYQIDKLLKMASSELDQNQLHPLSFKPNLDNLVAKDEEVGAKDEGDDDNFESSNSSVYVPPKVTAVLYEEDNKMSRKSRKSDKARQRSLNSALLHDLQHEYGDAPEELRNESVSFRRAKIKEKEDEREKFEEDNMRRLTLTKKDKLMRRELNNLDEVVKIGNFRGLGEDEDSDQDERYKPKVKKRKKGFGQGGKKFKKRMQRKR